MTRYEMPDGVADYFALRDTVAELLKEAGVKKHSRHAVAEVLIDAGVIDFAALEGDEEKVEHKWKIGDRALWGGTPGDITSFSAIEGELECVEFRADGRNTIRVIPIQWLTPIEEEQ